MSKGFSIQIEGLETLKKVLTNLPKEKMEQIEAEIEGTMYDIQAEAKRRCPNNLGGLANSITNPEREGDVWTISVQKFYAPYVNFGTGLYAKDFLETVDFAAGAFGSGSNEWTEYAMQFYVNGKGRIHGNGFWTYPVNQERLKLIKRVKDILLK